MTVPFHLEIEHRISVLVDSQIYLQEHTEFHSVTDQVILDHKDGQPTHDLQVNMLTNARFADSEDFPVRLRPCMNS